MSALTLQPSTIHLIAERMKREGYSSPDELVCDALAALKPTRAIPVEAVLASASEQSGSVQLNADEDLELDLSYAPVPLRQARSVIAIFVKAGQLEMVPFDGDL